MDDREEAARRIVAGVRAQRQPMPRWLWIVAIAIASACVGALTIGLLTAPDKKPLQLPEAHDGNSGFAIGAVIGLAVGVLIGWLIARRAASRT